MPTYDYQCTSCGHTFEVFQSMSDDRKKRCPKCRCKANRLISGGAGILFKGSGFYTTDYRSDGYKSAAKADNPSPPTTSGSPSDSKKKSNQEGSTSST